jgi:hypothetical protein
MDGKHATAKERAQPVMVHDGIEHLGIAVGQDR